MLYQRHEYYTYMKKHWCLHQLLSWKNLAYFYFLQTVAKHFRMLIDFIFSGSARSTSLTISDKQSFARRNDCDVPIASNKMTSHGRLILCFAVRFAVGKPASNLLEWWLVLGFPVSPNIHQVHGSQKICSSEAKLSFTSSIPASAQFGRSLFLYG